MNRMELLWYVITMGQYNPSESRKMEALNALPLYSVIRERDEMERRIEALERKIIILNQKIGLK